MPAFRSGLEELRIIYRCAQLYYEEDLSQKEIAKRLRISSLKVSRSIKRAKELGMVSIKVSPPREIPTYELESQLIKAFELQDAMVTLAVEPSKEIPTELEQLQVNRNIGLAAAHYFNREVKNGFKIGVSGGTTIGAMAQSLESKIWKLDIFPLVACGGELPAWTANTLVGLICIRLQEGTGSDEIKGHILPIPGFIKVEEEELIEKRKEELLSMPEVQKVYNAAMEEIDIAFTGIGTLREPSTLTRIADELGTEKVGELRMMGGVGDILYKIYDIRGLPLKCKFNEQIIGLPLERLKEMCQEGRRVVGLAGGEVKVKSTLGAINGGYINVLITDDLTARALLMQ